MAALDFPASPTVGQLYPTPAVPGVPVYKWDGEKWTTLGGALGSTGASDAIPQQDAGSGAAGSSTLWTRGDHAHPVDPSIATSIATKVAKAGDTMTGNLVITSNQPQMVLNKSAGGAGAYLGGYTNNKPRWFIELGDAAAETGGNAGSNLSFDRYTDAGAYIDSPFYFIRATGNISMPGSVTTGNITSSGTVSAGLIHASGNLQADNGVVYGAGGNNYITSDANTTTMLVNGLACYWSYTKATGYWQWLVNGAITMQLQYTPGFLINGPAYKPGGGVWSDSSDARIKTVKGAYATGLDAISQLNPVNFTYKGNDTSEPPDHVPNGDGSKSKEPVTVPYPNSMHRHAAESGTMYHGLIAQDIEAVFPEMVTKRDGYIDGVAVTDLRTIDATPLIYALVNAVKELKDRIETLESS